jgi:predicted metal-dependent phosphotriesterase family hydrolase
LIEVCVDDDDGGVGKARRSEILHHSQLGAVAMHEHVVPQAEEAFPRGEAEAEDATEVGYSTVLCRALVYEGR